MKRIVQTTFFLLSMLLTTASYSLAQEPLATPETIALLKQDLKSGKVRVGITRLKEFQRMYGDAPNISDTGSKIVYEYDDGLKVEFDRKRLWRGWSYDTDKKPAYNKNIDKLRFNLESQRLVGTELTTQKIFKDYEEPTEIVETTEDGNITVYYYGDIRLEFENVIEVRSWKGENFDQVGSSSLQNEEPAIPSQATSPINNNMVY